MKNIVSQRQKRYYSYSPKDIAKELLKRHSISKRQYLVFIRQLKKSTSYEFVHSKVEQFVKHTIRKQKDGLCSYVHRIKANTDKGLFSVALTKHGSKVFNGELHFFEGVNRHVDNEINREANAVVMKHHNEINEDLKIIGVKNL